MKVKELIKELEKVDGEANVVVEIGMNDGCETCGYGESSIDEDIYEIVDLETRIVLKF
jgi:hypothetical protein